MGGSCNALFFWPEFGELLNGRMLQVIGTLGKFYLLEERSIFIFLLLVIFSITILLGKEVKA